jgi:TPR repeat protein
MHCHSPFIIAALLFTLAETRAEGPKSFMYHRLAEGENAYDKKDYASALRLLLPLADHGDTIAEYYLGRMYSRGQGVPQDYVLGYMWFNLAAMQPTSDSRYRHHARIERERLAAKMTSEQLLNGQKLTDEWRPK